MSLETSLYSVLNGVCSPTYPMRAPNAPSYPYCVWYQIGGFTISPIAKEMPGKRNMRVQVDVWSKTALEAKTIIQQIHTALRTSALFIAREEGEFKDLPSEEDLDLYGCSMDFSIWGDR